MKRSIKTRNIELTPQIEKYIDKRLSYFDKFVKRIDPDAVVCEVEIERAVGDQRKGDIFRAEINLEVAGNLYRAEKSSESIFSSIDTIKEEISRQLKRGKERRVDLTKRGGRSIRKALGISKLARFRKSSKFKG